MQKPDSTRALAVQGSRIQSAMDEIEDFRRRGEPIPAHLYDRAEYKSALSQLLHKDRELAAYKKTNDPRVLGTSIKARAAALSAVRGYSKPNKVLSKSKGFK